ncbi:MAG: hypothetical protein A4S14_02870 [Proteobacteria bacterium SG_bin9]|nr:MAG: hypothetical protein A4S14_02870 [Proteobacteria bacterium SG_bin9]
MVVLRGWEQFAMLRSFLTYWFSFSLAGPAGLAAAFGLVEGSQKIGFDKKYSRTHQKLVNFLNDLVYYSIEHWFWYLSITALAAFMWALIVAEPKAVSKCKYHDRIRRIGR